MWPEELEDTRTHRGGELMESAASFAALSGWPLLAAAALVFVAVWLRSPRLLALMCMVVEGLLVFWFYSLWRLL
jgi:hypothetical protein